MVFVATSTNTNLENRWKPHVVSMVRLNNPRKFNHECQKTMKPRNFSHSKITVVLFEKNMVFYGYSNYCLYKGSRSLIVFPKLGTPQLCYAVP